MITSYNHKNFYDITFRSNIFNLNNSEIFSDKRNYSPIIRPNLSLIELSKFKKKTNYDPTFYYKNSQFSKEQLIRQNLKNKNLPHKQRIPYSIQLINYRKYGSSFDCEQESLILEKKPKSFSNQNSANISFDLGKNSKELKIMMSQSNIFNDDEKDKTNKTNIQKALKNSLKINKLKNYQSIKRESKSFNGYLHNSNSYKKNNNKTSIFKDNKNFAYYHNVFIKKKPSNYLEIEFNDSQNNINFNQINKDNNKNLKLNYNKIKQTNKLLQKLKL